jgi:predicted RNase H-like nuclease (RuvC/YqgF family)
MELKHINERFTDAQSHNSNFTNIATSNQNRNIQIIDSLRNEITKRERVNSNLNATINNLNKQIGELKLIINSQSNEIENLRKQ